MGAGAAEDVKKGCDACEDGAVLRIDSEHDGLLVSGGSDHVEQTHRTDNFETKHKRIIKK